MDIDAFLQLAQSRRATRYYEDEPLPEGVLDKMLEAARWAPSGFNMQPVHMVVVTDKVLKEKLGPACFKQAQVAQAPAVIFFCGDRDVYANNLEDVVKLSREAGVMNDAYEAGMRKNVGTFLNTAPAGLGAVAKWFMMAVGRWFTAVPNLPAVNRDFWLAKPVGLAAMNAMLAATAAGVDTSPMEGFDHTKVQKVLGLPANIVPIIIVCAGKSAKPHKPTPRFPLERMVHRNGW